MADRQIQALAVLKAALGGLASRQRATAANLANIDTPGYTPTHVDFESVLQSALEQSPSSKSTPLRVTDPRHMRPEELAIAGELASSKGVLVQRNDGSGVDLDQEAMIMADTEVRFGAVTGLIKSQFSWLRGVISDGRR